MEKYKEYLDEEEIINYLLDLKNEHVIKVLGRMGKRDNAIFICQINAGDPIILLIKNIPLSEDQQELTYFMMLANSPNDIYERLMSYKTKALLKGDRYILQCVIACIDNFAESIPKMMAVRVLSKLEDKKNGV